MVSWVMATIKWQLIWPAKPRLLCIGATQAVAFDGSLLGSGRTLKGHGERRGPFRQNAVAGCGFVKTCGNWTDGDVLVAFDFIFLHHHFRKLISLGGSSSNHHIKSLSFFILAFDVYFRVHPLLNRGSFNDLGFIKAPFHLSIIIFG